MTLYRTDVFTVWCPDCGAEWHPDNAPSCCPNHEYTAPPEQARGGAGSDAPPSDALGDREDPLPQAGVIAETSARSAPFSGPGETPVS